MNRRARTASLVACFLLAACGPDPLSGLGEGASEWIGEPTVSTLPLEEDEGPTLSSIGGVEWYNEDLTPVPGTSPGEVIAGVFARSSPSDRFAQATPAEMAAALPDMVFPSQLPPEVDFITSQLVYDRATGQLAEDQVAAFGLWIVEPYTQSRSVGQQGIYNVVYDPAGADLIESNAADLTCGRFSAYPGACEESDLDGLPAWLLTDQTGLTLVWYQGDFRYEMFVRIGVPEEIIYQVAGSARPLSSIVG